jgi:large subunit ribosomal protein L21
MYAVIRTGGKQYSVAVGNQVEVEKLDGDVGSTITLEDVLLIANGDNVQVGQPTVAGATVVAKITGQYRGNKIIVFRYRPKKRIRVRKGHRQYLTRLQIESINA